jgi:phage terminase small subunit
MPGPLANQRAEKFCQLIVAGDSTVTAYQKAGWAADSSNACHMRSKPHIEARIAELMGKAAAKATVTRAKVLEALSEIAFSSVADVIRIDEETGLATVDLSQATREQLSAVTEVVTEHGPDGRPARTRLKLADRKSALDSLGRSLGMFTDRVESGRPGDFTGAQTSDDIADRMLKEAGIAEPSEDAKTQVKMALSHLTECIKAIAAGETAQADSNPYRVGEHDSN